MNLQSIKTLNLKKVSAAGSRWPAGTVARALHRARLFDRHRNKTNRLIGATNSIRADARSLLSRLCSIAERTGETPSSPPA